MSLKGNAGLRWTPPGGSETTHPLQHPLRLEAAPTLRRRRRVVDAWDYSSRTAFESDASAEEFTTRHRFEDFPRRLLRLLDHAAGGVQVDYYPDLDRETAFPLLLIDASEEQSLDPDADRFGYGEYERDLRLRSADGTPLWPLYVPVGFEGAGEENLLRDAAMDTDSDGDGVVDGWSIHDQNTGWTFSLNGTDGAQEMTADGTGSSGDRAVVRQDVIRIFPGDTVTFSVEARLASPTDIVGRIQPVWEDEGGGFISGASPVDFTHTSYQRVELTATAPDGAGKLYLPCIGRLTADSGSGDVRFRNARLLRGTSDPATYANPHVSGGSQTGDTLDTAGWPASQANVVRAGDVIRAGGSGETQALADDVSHFLRAAEDVDSDGSGLATIPITVEIGAGNSPADGAALRLTHPMF